jgi:hypothetical protein
VWFATLVGWSGGLVDASTVAEHVKATARVVLRGVR